MPALVELDHVAKSYGPGRRVIDDLDLTVEVGERVAIIGRSGSGKSTLLNLIGGISQADEGTVVTCGETVSDMNESQAAKFRLAHIGFVFQAIHLLPRLRVWENVVVPLVLGAGVDDKWKPRAVELLDLVGLADFADKMPGPMSGGERQRVAIARALVSEPKLLLADEPTGNLDTESAASVVEVFERVAKEHSTTLITVTHDLELANRFERVVEISDGRIAPDKADP